MKKTMEERRSRTWIDVPGLPKYRASGSTDTSAAEEVVIACLKKIGLYFIREVYFEGLVNDKTGNPLRCDFFIPAQRKIIEYDGAHHNNPTVKYRDNIKDEFAKKHNIEMVRITEIENIFVYFGLPFVPLEKIAYMGNRLPKKKTRIIENPVSYISNSTSPTIRKQIERIKNQIRDNYQPPTECEFCEMIAKAELYADYYFTPTPTR